MTSTLFDSIREIYTSADAAVAAAGPVCESSGRCCRFTEYGHTLFLSDLEAEYLLKTAPGYHRVTPDGCPFQIDGLCTARDERPLGCRVYFCDPKFQDAMPVILETHLQKLKQLANELERPWRYAPLHVFLQEALDAGRIAPVIATKRVPLPIMPTERADVAPRR
jgi:Fe-S-cluster containining protein